MATGKRGRPKYEPDDRARAQVRAMAGMGISHDDIARVMQISPPTLRRAFRAELSTGKVEANTKVAASLFRMATDAQKPNVAAAIFWMKTQCGWVEPRAQAPGRYDLPPAPQRLGKKEQAQADAKTAQEGTEWDELLPRSAPLQ